MTDTTPDTTTRAQRNRQIRQEALREQLATGGHIQYAIDLADKLNDAADSFEVQKYKAAFDARMKLVGKYLPDMKSTEISTEEGVTYKVVIGCEK